MYGLDQQKEQDEGRRNQVEHLRFEFMRAELDIAAVFLEIADTTRELKTRSRNLENAWKAHQDVTKLLAKPGCSNEDRVALEGRLAELSEQLNARGVLPE